MKSDVDGIGRGGPAPSPEDIECETFAKDGYKDAAAQIGQIEQALGFASIVQFTVPQRAKA